MLILYIVLIALIPVLAEALRYIVHSLTQGGGVTLIPWVLDLTRSENRGVAFGLFQNSTVFFAITTSIMIIAFVILLIRNYKKSKLFSFSCVLIIGGGIANLFERIVYGYVFDYLKLSFFPPVCNFADYCITAGTVMLIIYLIFFSDFFKKDAERKPVGKAAEDEAD